MRDWRRLLGWTLVCALFGSPAVCVGQQDLEPADDVFSYVEPPDPYHLALRKALVGHDPYRKCQVVAIPSFQREWAVYMVREKNAPPMVVFRQVRKQLWVEMMQVISDNGRRSSYSMGADAQRAALERVALVVDTSSIPLSVETADVLEDVWWRMLSRVQYPKEDSAGLDGTTYHVSHWKTSVGFRSGRTWSPPEGSRPAALVRMAEGMRDLAAKRLAGGEAQLLHEARALLRSLE